MNGITSNTASQQSADIGPFFKALKAFRSNKTTEQLSSKNILKGFVNNGTIDGIEEPSSLTYCKCFFLTLY